MSSRYRVIAIALALVGTAVRTAPAQAGLKIVYVNTDALMQAVPGRAHVDSVMAAARAAAEAQFNTKQAAFQKDVDAYKQAQATMPEATKTKTTGRLQAEQDSLATLNTQLQDKLQQQAQALTDPLQQKVLKVLDDMREEDGYSYIVSQASFLVADKNLDKTDEALRRLKALPP
ncbi:MAG TPA: OmpH family outer membrane protein [Gemmatimonadaceae bacterium]|nr:OmpH family outer membrane protein [Gemmatimonadaceae bacterium]